MTPEANRLSYCLFPLFLIIASVLSFLFLMMTTMVIVRLIVYLRRKAELDFSWLFLDQETFLEFNNLSKESLIIMILFLFGVVWYLFIGGTFRIPMIFVLLALIQIIAIVYIVKKTTRIPKEVK